MTLCFRAKEVYEFTYTYPYSYTELQRWLLGLERVDAPYLQRRLLCRTPQMKRVDMLTIEDLPKSQVGMVRQCLLACIVFKTSCTVEQVHHTQKQYNLTAAGGHA